MADFESLESSLQSLERTMAAAVDAISSLASKFSESAQADKAQQATAGAGGAPARTSAVGKAAEERGGLGGELLDKIAARGPAIAAAGVAGAGAAVGQGIVDATRGGSFSGGASAQINQLAAKIPVFGELSGAQAATDVAKGVRQDFGQLEAAVAAGAEFDDQTLRALAGVSAQQNERVVKFRQKVAAITNDVTDQRGPASTVLGSTGLGGFLAGIPEIMRNVNKQFDQSGLNQHK